MQAESSEKLAYSLPRRCRTKGEKPLKFVQATKVVKNLQGCSKISHGVLYENAIYIRTIFHVTIGILSFDKVQYLYTSTAVLSRKYSSIDGEVLQFGYIQIDFSLCWKKIFTEVKKKFKPLKIFEKSNADGKGIKKAREKQRSTACSPLVHLPKGVLIVLLYENHDVD